MPRRPDVLPTLTRMLARVDDRAPTIPRKVELLQSVRAQVPAQGAAVDRVLVEEVTRLSGETERLSTGLKAAQVHQQELRDVLTQLAVTPWHPAVYLEQVETCQGARVVVAHGRSRRVVGLADGVDSNSLKKGDVVYLGSELNVVMDKAAGCGPPCGEIAAFARYAPGGRLVLSRRGDEEVVVDMAGPLENVDLKVGDLLRWSDELSMAAELMPRPEQKEFLLEEIPDIERDQVGGQSANLDTLLSTLTATLVAPERAEAYGLNGRQSILMVGPPGCGKTRMTQVAAAEIARLNGKQGRFVVVKPGEFEDPYVGQTQRRIRDCFEALCRAAQEGFAVLFLDEIESIGRIRGGWTTPHADKFLAALLAELDGFTDRSNVAVIAATNRKELVDPALLERLCDVEIVVDRPDRRGAREIFEIHLPLSLPYAASNGSVNGEIRAEIIDTAVSRFYSPNADNTLCTLRFRDGKTRTIAARDLASGRCFEQICRVAKRIAFQRDVSGEDRGLCVADMESAVSGAFERLTSTLTPSNAGAYLSDLPQDVDVVSVEPVARKVRDPQQYLNVA